MKTAGVREFKARLSHYLSEVRRGEVVLVTDRGEVVAEVRKPTSEAIADPLVRALWPLVARGELRLGDPSLPGARLRAGVETGTSAEEIDRELADVRGESSDDEGTGRAPR